MKIEHQKDLGFGLITPASEEVAKYLTDITFGKHYAKVDSCGNFYDDVNDERPYSWYEDGEMIDVVAEQPITHNIEAGDWTCWQNDEELYSKLVQAFENAGFDKSKGYTFPIDEKVPIIGCWEFKGFNYYEADSRVDGEFRTYRTPEYLLSALNAQPKPIKSDKDIEIEKIIEHFDLDESNDKEYAETLYDGGFRVDNLDK